MLKVISRQTLAALLLCSLTLAPFIAPRAQSNAAPGGEPSAAPRRGGALKLIEEVLQDPGRRAPRDRLRVDDDVPYTAPRLTLDRATSEVRQPLTETFGDFRPVRTVTTLPSMGTVIYEVKGARANIMLSGALFRLPTGGGAEAGK